jgi:CheY-like chemotaxis protein
LARTVLLADDSVTAQNMGRRILIDAGYEVVTVNNGSAALKKVHESRPDLIVLDVYMPGYGGLEVCQRLKESDETAKIPILLTVGKMEPFKTDEAKRVRADAHIVKPFEASELLAALTKLEDRIVPQQELPRGRKSKPEKRSKPSRAFDPTMSFDDTQSDKIAYLAEVKQRRSEKEQNGEEDFVEAESMVSDAPSAKEESLAAMSEGPNMPRPMSVYAAEALRELPVVPEAVPTPEQTAGSEQEANSAQATLPMHPADPLAAIAAAGESESFHAAENQPVEDAQVQVVSADAPAVPLESAEPAEPPVASIEVESQARPESEQAPAVQSEAAVQSHAEAPSTPQVSQAEEMPAAPDQNTAIASRWVAENVALTPEEAALELEHEMQQLQAGQNLLHATASGEASTATPSDEPPVEIRPTEPAESNGATFAAAAAASGSSSAVSSSSSETGHEPPAASETAAAWENWQHIRDSVMGSQTAVSLSESVAEVVQASAAAAGPDSLSSDAPAQSSPSSEPSADLDAESAALSSIVDSVLAELKPKLMQEISKKLKK